MNSAFSLVLWGYSVFCQEKQIGLPADRCNFHARIAALPVLLLPGRLPWTVLEPRLLRLSHERIGRAAVRLDRYRSVPNGPGVD